MKSRLLIGIVISVFGSWLTAQDAPTGKPQSTSQPVATAATNKGCVIVKHKGTVGRRLMFTALMGVPIAPGAKYDLVDSMNYPVPKPALKGKELQRMQADGVRVIVLEKNYTQESLDSARKSCREGQAPEPAQNAPKQ